MAAFITITGEESVGYYANLLSNVMFANHADEPGMTNRTVVFELVDDRGFSVSAQTIVRIIPTNDPAQLNFNERVALFDEMSQTPVNLFLSTDFLADPDGNTLTWAVVEIRPAIDEMDILSVDVGTSGLEISSGNAMLNISGYANFSVYEAVLRSLTFHNPSPALNLSNRTILITLFDGETESPSTFITVVIDAFDDGPVCYFNSMVGAAIFYTLGFTPK